MTKFLGREVKIFSEGEKVMFRKSASGWLKHLDFLVIDLISLEVSFFCAYLIRHGSMNPYSVPIYRNMSLMLIFLDVCVFFFMETLSGVLRRGYYQEFMATLKHDVAVILLSVLYLFSIQAGESYSRTTLFMTGIIYFILSYISRRILRVYLDRSRLRESGKRSMLIVATKAGIEEIVKNIKDNNYERLRIAGIAVLDADMIGQKIHGVPVVADKATVIEHVCREWVDEVFLSISNSASLRETMTDQFVEMGVIVHLKLVKANNIKGRKQYVEQLGSYTVLSTGVNMMTIRQVVLKRMMDIAGGLVGCLITAVLFIFVAPLIYVKSPGPIFFKQTRVGKNGKLFKMYKFRSMYMDAEERKKELMSQNKIKDGLMFKMDFDPRIIGSEKGPGKGIGNFIRKYSIDEFPQFINVLKGDMSLVGTRPPTVDEWEKYELHHRARLAVKPGITGMWQVSGRSSITDFEEVVKLDTKYIINWSFALDLKILFKTVGSVIKKDGAA